MKLMQLLAVVCMILCLGSLGCACAGHVSPIDLTGPAYCAPTNQAPIAARPADTGGVRITPTLYDRNTPIAASNMSSAFRPASRSGDNTRYRQVDDRTLSMLPGIGQPTYASSTMTHDPALPARNRYNY